MRHAFPDPRLVDVGGIRMACYEQGQGPPVICVHGFPELAFSWRHQLPALAAAGYRAIAPDMRGYGGSDKPDRVDDYSVQKLIADLTGLLDSLEFDDALFVGHDWGAILLWQMALLEPRRMHGVINLNIPHFPRPPIDPIKWMRWKLGKEFYIVNFQDSDEADRRFATDPAHFINMMMRRGQITRERFSSLPKELRVLSLLRTFDRQDAAGEPLLTDAELRYYADAFSAGGFSGPINWYRNFSHNWRSTKGVDQTVRVPALFIGAVDDVIISPRQIEAMRPYVADLEVHMLGDCGHWTQQEKPEELNRLMLGWLRRRFPPDQ